MADADDCWELAFIAKKIKERYLDEPTKESTEGPTSSSITSRPYDGMKDSNIKDNGRKPGW